MLNNQERAVIDRVNETAKKYHLHKVEYIDGWYTIREFILNNVDDDNKPHCLSWAQEQYYMACDESARCYFE